MTDTSQTLLTVDPWWESHTTIALIVGKVVLLGNVAGIAFDPNFANSMTNFICDGVTVFSMVTAAYLHWKAKKGITAKANQLLTGSKQ